MKVAAIIPARLASRRFPRKVLARETGKFLFQHVYERVVGCPGIDLVRIATDSEEVLSAGRSFGADIVLTSPAHVSGTDRVAEVAAGLDHDVIINVQGDEPLIEHADLATLIRLFDPREDPASGRFPGGGERENGDEAVMTTLATAREDIAGFRDPNIVKVVVGIRGNALYFSRSPVPYSDALSRQSGGVVEWLQHIGIYAYRRSFLLRLAKLPPTALEKRERLEQLRVLEHGYALRVGVTEHRHIGIDTEEEYRRFVEECRGSRPGK